MNRNEAFGIPIPGGAAIGALTRLRALESLHAEMHGEEGLSFFSTIQRALDIRCDVTAEELARVPATGPLLVVANHPFGAAEGIVLAHVIGSVRRDVRVLANHLLARIPELREELVLVDPFHPGATEENVRGLRHAIRHLQGGGALVVFPAGTVSHWQPGRRGISDPQWSVSVARLARRTRASVLPVYFPGSNGPLFQLAGLVHPSLRTALLPQALLDRRHTSIEMRVGNPIPFGRLTRFASDEALTAHLRRRTYVLAHRNAGTKRTERDVRSAIAPPIPPETLLREIGALPSDSLVASNGDLDVFLCARDRIPNTLLEIGRLREVTFRAAGEGSGRPRDLDAYDSFYRHLFIWNRATHEIVGAYRLGIVDEILPRFGPSGLYTSTLFRYSARFFDAVGRRSIEMGRSFIRAEYQRSYTPLLLLWKGIAALVARNPRYCVLFGPASISADFHPQSRALMARYLMQQAASEIAGDVAPRRPFRTSLAPEVAGEIGALDDLQELIAEIERGQRAIPVLLRQYLNLGGRVAALNVDAAFSDVLDALVVVDLRQTDAKTLSRYMGPAEYRAFADHHANARRGEHHREHREHRDSLCPQ